MLPWKQISTAPSQKFDDLLPPKTSLSGNKPSLVIYFLGSFRVYHDNQLVSEWKSLKGLSILKYLLANHDKRVTKDTLMDIFWPDAPPESARRNLHQAIYSLRQTLIEIRPDFQHILYEADTYILNPELTTWIDYSEFDQHFHVGRQLESTGDMRAAMDAYAISEELYGGDFLEEELYETWMIPKRQVYQNCYVFVTNRLSDHFWRRGDLSTAVTYCRKLLTKDNCHEETHRRLIQCYMAQGQLQLAIRQYFTCVNYLQDELSVDPSPETNALYDHLINNA